EALLAVAPGDPLGRDRDSAGGGIQVDDQLGSFEKGGRRPRGRKWGGCRRGGPRGGQQQERKKKKGPPGESRAHSGDQSESVRRTFRRRAPGRAVFAARRRERRG